MEVLYHEKNVDTDNMSFWEIFCKTKHAKERQKKTWNKKRPWNDPFFIFQGRIDIYIVILLLEFPNWQIWYIVPTI